MQAKLGERAPNQSENEQNKKDKGGQMPYSLRGFMSESKLK
jgi:hypothetical protein